MSEQQVSNGQRALRKTGRRTLDDEIRTEDTHGGNTNTRLGSAVGGTQAGEDNGAGAAHGTKEGLCNALASSVYHIEEPSLGWRWSGSMSPRLFIGDVVGTSGTGGGY